MGYPRAGYEIGDIIELGEDHLQWLLGEAWDGGYQARVQDEYTAVEAYGTTYYDQTPNPYRNED